MKDVKRKMDLKTAEYIVDKVQNDPSVFPVEFQECPLCGAQYIEELGHDCKNVIELTWHEYEEGVPIPQQGTAYIFDDGSNIEYIGKAVLVEKRDEE